MGVLESVIFGVVEGFTEFLPISSTGHLMLLAELLDIQQTDFIKSFEIAIQSGAILSVVVLYWRDLLIDRAIIKRVTVGFLPTAAVGLIFYRIVKNFLFQPSVAVWALLVGGIFLIIFEKKHRDNESAVNDIRRISYRQAFWVGLAQSVALVPGVSRAAATIVGGMMAGIKRTTVVEFSFLLAVPTMIAATGLDLLKNFNSFSAGELDILIVGFIISFISAILGVRFLTGFIKNHTLLPFGVYRVVLALGFLLLVF